MIEITEALGETLVKSLDADETFPPSDSEKTQDETDLDERATLTSERQSTGTDTPFLDQSEQKSDGQDKSVDNDKVTPDEEGIASHVPSANGLPKSEEEIRNEDTIVRFEKHHDGLPKDGIDVKTGAPERDDYRVEAWIFETEEGGSIEAEKKADIIDGTESDEVAEVPKTDDNTEIPDGAQSEQQAVEEAEGPGTGEVRYGLTELLTGNGKDDTHSEKQDIEPVRLESSKTRNEVEALDDSHSEQQNVGPDHLKDPETEETREIVDDALSEKQNVGPDQLKDPGTEDTREAVDGTLSEQKNVGPEQLKDPGTEDTREAVDGTLSEQKNVDPDQLKDPGTEDTREAVDDTLSEQLNVGPDQLKDPGTEDTREAVDDTLSEQQNLGPDQMKDPETKDTREAVDDTLSKQQAVDIDMLEGLAVLKKTTPVSDENEDDTDEEDKDDADEKDDDEADNLASEGLFKQMYLVWALHM